MIRQKWWILFLLLGFFFPASSVFAGTVLSDFKYAWGDNLGYVNFDNVIVDDTSLSGYAWSSNYGWINLQPLTGGVSNDIHGNLSGFAWGEQLGWIDFDGVSINPSTGKFSGTAYGSLAGTITFDCSNYCDVRTDWLGTASAQIQVSAGDGRGVGGGGGVFLPPALSEVSSPVREEPFPVVSTEPVVIKNKPFILPPGKSGTFTEDTPVGPIILSVPTNSTVGDIIFTLHNEPLSESLKYLLPDDTNLVNGIFFNVFVKNEKGELIHSFAEPLTITLPIPKNLLKSKNLAVYWLNETNSQWVLIPEVSFVKNSVIFQVNHLTRFAIFETYKTQVGGVQKKSSAIVLPFVAPTSSFKTAIIPLKNEKNVTEDFQSHEALSLRDIWKKGLLFSLVLVSFISLRFFIQKRGKN